MSLTSFTPDTNIHLCAGVPLDTNYRDTYSFSTASEQATFFISKAKFSFIECAPVRFGESIRIPVNANKCYDCSYLMFQNSNFNNKWFYAFITNIEWLSINDAVVYYEIDDIQTWYFEAQYPPCFVQRQHVLDDTVGKNLTPENFELGEYIITETLQTGLFQNYKLLAACSVDKQGNPSVGGYYSGLYNGLSLNVFDSASTLNSFLTSMTTQNKSNSIVSIIMFPSEFIQDKGTDTATLRSFTMPKLQSGALNGYTPKNNKLYTYPYNFILCSNLAGSSAEFRYEEFDSASANFVIYVDMSCNPTAVCVPMQYLGSENENWNEKITMDGFPQCSWTTDTFKAWLAQNGSSMAISTMGTALSGIGSLVSGNIGGVLNSVESIAQTVAKVNATQSLPPQAHGPTAGSALVAMDKKDFYFFRLTLQKEFLTIIDDYFDMFGYAVHEVKSPTHNNRESWDYIKTQECKVLGDLPMPARRRIENIFNAGIRFWHGDFLGQFWRQNNPLEAKSFEQTQNQ